ncbi:MAG: hypothetical protein V2A54_13465 [Bacteroidota bacterium]
MVIINFFLEAASILKVLEVILVSAFKFFIAPIVSFQMGFSYIQTILTTAIGGIISVLFFYFLSEWLIHLYFKITPKIRMYIRKKRGLEPSSEKIRKRKVFSPRNRRIVKNVKRYGLHGLIWLTPVLFSIPLGTFLISRYFSHKRNILLYLSFSILGWAFAISTFLFIFRKHT